MTNSNNNSNKKKLDTSELDISVGSLSRLLTNEIKNLDTLSFNQHKQIDQCKEVIENLNSIYSKLKDASIHLSQDIDNTGTLQSGIFSNIQQFEEALKVLDTITSAQKELWDILTHLNVDLYDFFDGKNKEFRITRDNFNEVITKLAAINTNVEAIKLALDILPNSQQNFLAEKFNDIKTDFIETRTSIVNAQNSINQLLTDNFNKVSKALTSVDGSVALTQKTVHNDSIYFMVVLILVGVICIYFGRYSYFSSQKIDQLNDSINSLKTEIQAIKRSPSPTPSILPTKSDKKR